MQRFIEEILVHTKGVYSRQRFLLAPWQRDDIVRPLFGETVWSVETEAYVRRYRVAWIELGRKALEVATPVLTANRGWVAVGDLVVGDLVFSLDGKPTAVDFVSDVYEEPAFRVRTRFGRELVAGGDHDWLVHDRRYPRGALRVAGGRRLKPTYGTRRLSTSQIVDEGLRWNRAYRFAVPDHGSVQLAAGTLPIDPYVLGAWLGDGTSKSGAMTSHQDDQLFMRRQFEQGGYETRATAHPQVFYAQKLMTTLRALGVLHNKHIPESYLLASAEDRLALLQGLMDTDGWATVKATSLMAGFCSKHRHVADGVMFLARSLEFHPSMLVKSTVRAFGKTYGPYYEVRWSIPGGSVVPFRLPRKATQVRTSTYRSQLDSVVSVEPVGVRSTRCIGVEHPSHVFLAGTSLLATSNCGKSELLAAVMLYLLVGDGEESAELYGVARDRDQAALVFDVAARMAALSPILTKRLDVKPHNRRIVDRKSASVYAVIAADAPGALGSNPSGVAADEILAWRDRSMWDAMRTGMGSGARRNPLMVAATTAGNDPAGFAAKMHAEMRKVADDPDRARHVFVYMRNTPTDADPWDEANWYHANPALGDFLSLESMRQEATEAKNDPAAENAFRQFRLCQWVAQSSRWVPMHLYRASCGDLWLNPDYMRERMAGRQCFAGFDLSGISDLTSWCLLFPDRDGGVDVTWRHWVPEAKLRDLDAVTNGSASQWVKAGWLTTCEGNRIDYDGDLYPAIEADARDFTISGADADQFSMFRPVQEIGERTGLQVTTYTNTYQRMTPGGDELMTLLREGNFRHHGNPVAEWCFDNVEIYRAKFDANLYRFNKPDRGAPGARIDAVPAAVMAVNAWKLAAPVKRSVYEDNDGLFVV